MSLAVIVGLSVSIGTGIYYGICQSDEKFAPSTSEHPPCVTQGCSGSICVHEDTISSNGFGDIMTICTYTPQDAFIDRFGVCELQSNETCGWTYVGVGSFCKSVGQIFPN